MPGILYQCMQLTCKGSESCGCIALCRNLGILEESYIQIVVTKERIPAYMYLSENMWLFLVLQNIPLLHDFKGLSGIFKMIQARITEVHVICS